MINNLSSFSFFKPTPELRKLIILEEIRKNNKISQLELSKFLNIAVSMINKYIYLLNKDNYIHKSGINTKNMEYYLTKKGESYREFLLLTYSHEVIKLYKMVNNNFILFFNSLKEENIKSVVFYGAGEVAEIAIEIISNLKLDLVSIVDDDKEKQDKLLKGNRIYPVKYLEETKFDSIIITSFTDRDKMFKKIEHWEKKGKIIKFLKM